MKTWRIFLLTILIAAAASLQPAAAQCSICTKTSMQQGEKPARGMNSGIVYLMLTPFVVMGFLGYRWYKNQQGEF
ncbi:hypothetical protein [Aridibaculum aurantiacum]|uniref:hypothetical protein n=1 Tax=Aridibaculum aurantiacum TaxID=2810307 RepID=UPI001A975609|nr:hypothetical protein [Aridibaculum aurantiacum]